ncbi:hypothetical protein [Burkholderia pseudomultivorans]|uniref:Lipoprotein n=1 Tax=Burkholderia pseudomultivorans TaxID=1207504 RepID=A0A132E9Z5_9BURK|nr:hypothetical protein [Burkholderia pseudomultivorans]KWF22767.1 hypothetical protein WT56_01075 [Burkholderia pseudomultivorans]
MKPNRTIYAAASALAVACALGACTQPSPVYGTHQPPPAPPDGHASPPTATMPDANTRYDTRPSPGNTLPPGTTSGTPADVPDPGPNGAASSDRPLPGTPPPMQY